MTLTPSDYKAPHAELERYRAIEEMRAQGRLTEAAEALRKLARAGTTHWQVYHDLGMLAMEAGELVQARDYLERAVALEPVPGAASLELARCYRLRGRSRAGFALMGGILARDPDSDIAKRGLAELLRTDAAATGEESPVFELRARYEPRPPSPRTIVELFGDDWKSALPGIDGSGDRGMFDDQRPAWLASRFDGGLAGRSVLELGPFEGYQTWLLDRLGAREIVSVEANSINFLKCLCVKELYGLKSQLQFGDVIGYMAACERRFDVVFASGVLYHMQDPLRFITLAAGLAPALYLWTRVYDASIQWLGNNQASHFLPEQNQRVRVDGREITLHARSYLISGYRDQVPPRWEGGQEDLSYWLEKADLLWLLQRAGLSRVDVHNESTVNGLPCISLLAARD